MSKPRAAILVFLLTFLIYSPLLSNQFVGDDNIIFGRNTFYASWKNIPRLFEKGYISNVREINFNSKSLYDFGTGSVSYRPVSNLSYFIDHYIFGSKPFGSHLINILIHCTNALLVYGIVELIFASPLFAVFASLLFSLHPIQSEAVAVMSYRADILAAMFALSSFYFWIRFAQSGYVKRGYYLGSLSMCVLALFSKESAFTLPLIVLLYDKFLAAPKQGVKPQGIYYLGFILVLALHAYLYFFVFPNVTLAFHWLGGSFTHHCLIMGFIWFNYLINILLPWTVKVIPGLYCPPAPALISLTTAVMLAFMVLLLTGLVYLWRHSKEAAFFLLWYLIFCLPVSNLIPIANPMASRFMYLPSIGILIAAAYLFDKAFKNSVLKAYCKDISGLFYGFLIIICVTKTMFLNTDWKDDFYVGWAWVRDYPLYGRGYALMGKEYLEAGELWKAQEYLEKSVLLGDQRPSEVLYLAECYMGLGKSQAAGALLDQIILRYPDYADALKLKALNERSLHHQL